MRRVKYPNYASFPSLDVARREYCGPKRESILLRTELLVSCSKHEMRKKCPQTLRFEGLDSFLRVSQQGPCFTALEEDGGDKRRVQLERAFEAECVALTNAI